MTDAERAQQALAGHTIALCKGEELITGDARGISPMICYIQEGRDLRGFSVADVIVGKAAAYLFVYAGIVSVYAKVLSEAGAEVLERYGIPYTYGTMTEKIINRKGDDVCPMEKAVRDISDPAQAFCVLQKTLAALR